MLFSYIFTYEKDDKIFWFEHSWEKHRGIHKYNSSKELLVDVRDKFIKDELKNKFKQQNLVLHEYQKPSSHITVQEFYKHCENNDNIDLDNLKWKGITGEYLLLWFQLIS